MDLTRRDRRPADPHWGTVARHRCGLALRSRRPQRLRRSRADRSRSARPNLAARSRPGCDVYDGVPATWLANPRPAPAATVHCSPRTARFRRPTARSSWSAPGNEEIWRLCSVLGLEHLAADPRFASNSSRVANHAALTVQIETARPADASGMGISASRRRPTVDRSTHCRGAGRPTGGYARPGRSGPASERRDGERDRRADHVVLRCPQDTLADLRAMASTPARCCWGWATGSQIHALVTEGVVKA